MKPRTNRATLGFTLIELLIVIVIIGILASLLAPVLVQAKKKSKEVNCASNLRDFGMGVSLYIADSDDQYPSGVEKFIVDRGGCLRSDGSNPCLKASLIEEIMSPYLRSQQTYRCPLDVGFTYIEFGPAPPAEYRSSFLFTGSSYWYNEDLFVDRFSGTSVVLPAQGILSSDRTGSWHGSGPTLGDPGVIPVSEFMSTLKTYRSNYLFCDVHVKSGTPRQWIVGRASVYGGTGYDDGTNNIP